MSHTCLNVHVDFFLKLYVYLFKNEMIKLLVTVSALKLCMGIILIGTAGMVWFRQKSGPCVPFMFSLYG